MNSYGDVKMGKIINNLKQTKFAQTYRIIKKSRFYFYPSKLYLSHVYKIVFGVNLNLENPQKFSEKLQWLKLYWHDELIEKCTDKYLVREYVKSKNLGHLLNKLIKVYDNVEDINLDELPEKFVLRATHGSGSNVICNNKDILNWEEKKKFLKKCMKRNYYWPSREWNYKRIKPRIVCEEYLVDSETNQLNDYKFFCFDGTPRFVQVDIDRFTNHKRNFYDSEWNKLPLVDELGNFEGYLPATNDQLDEMKHYASILSKSFPHVRADFYLANNNIYFGELTFFDGGGFTAFTPNEYDSIFGEMLKLPIVKKI
jgi:hypothetical protein